MKALIENKDSRFVTDKRGAKEMNVSVNTFRKIAEECDAVYFFMRSRRTDMEKLRANMDIYKA